MSRAFLTCFLCIGTTILFAQEAIVYEPEQMHADLNKFKTALIKIHPGTYAHQSHEEFELLVNNLMLETSKPLPAPQFYRTVLKLIASIHDGHTQAYTFGKLGAIINNQKRLPFQVYVQNERVFIVKNMSPKQIPEGSEILAIDGRLSNQILHEISQHYSSDGQSRSGIYHWLRGPYKPFNRLYPEIFGERLVHSIVYRDYKTREIMSANVEAIPHEDYKKTQAKKYPSDEITNEAFSFNIKTKEGFAYLKINRFIENGFDEPENIFPDFYKRCFEEISKENIDNLIIDLRDNGGGKASNAAYLLQYFTSKPFTPAKEVFTLGNDSYFLKITGDTLTLDNSFGLKPKKDGTFKVTRPDVLRDLMTYQPIEKYKYSGTLIVLIDGGTTSAAGIAAGLLKEYTNAVFVGEETYGYAGISNGVRQISVRGDSTETAIYLPLIHAEYSIDKQVQKRSVVPDYQVSNSVHDILANKDAILEFVFKELLSNK